MAKNLNWSNLAHEIGDLYDDKEYTPVRVRFPDGRVFFVTSFDTENMELVIEPTEVKPRKK